MLGAPDAVGSIITPCRAFGGSICFSLCLRGEDSVYVSGASVVRTPCRIVRADTAAQSAGVLSIEEAYAAVRAYCRRILERQKRSEEVPLLQSLGRVLAA